MPRRRKHPRQSRWRGVFQGTRLAVATVIENLEDLSVEEVMEQFDVTREQIVAVLEFVAESLRSSTASLPASCNESMEGAIRNPDVRRGNPTVGLYPDVSRHKLAAKKGCSPAYLSRVLLGRHPVKGFTLMLKIATEIGIPPEQLERDLVAAQRSYRRKHRVRSPRRKPAAAE